MSRAQALVDSSYLFTYFNKDDPKREDAILVSTVYEVSLIIPQVVLTEVAYIYLELGQAFRQRHDFYRR